jgi:predicted RecB family endonuclease
VTHVSCVQDSKAALEREIEAANAAVHELQQEVKELEQAMLQAREQLKARAQQWKAVKKDHAATELGALPFNALEALQCVPRDSRQRLHAGAASVPPASLTPVPTQYLGTCRRAA